MDGQTDQVESVPTLPGEVMRRIAPNWGLCNPLRAEAPTGTTINLFPVSRPGNHWNQSVPAPVPGISRIQVRNQSGYVFKARESPTWYGRSG
jgi:hypothetical protein